MKLIGVSVAAMLAALVATPAAAQTKVTIAISGWTGFCAADAGEGSRHLR